MFWVVRWLFFLNFYGFVILNGFPQQGSVPAKPPLQRYEYSRPQMGTIFRVVLFAPSESIAKVAAEAALNRVDTLNQILSDYIPDSELNKLSATAGTIQAVPLSPDLWAVLQKSQRVSRKTNGAFDVTVGPVVQLWRRARRQHQMPSPEALIKAQATTGYQHIILKKKQKTAQLLVPGMQLDMGAIGKGYAVDEAMRVLQQHKIKIALVDGGGNIRVSQAPPGTPGWEIDLSISNETDHIGGQKIYLKNAGVATSGDLYQFVEINGQRYSHIINPFTGLGLTDQRRVTIVAKNGTDADWLSTALSVLPTAQGIKLANRTPQAAASIVWNTNGKLQQAQSRRFRQLKWVK
ncbi:FAD:protein FMN transferase [Adhaeribacter pallidiroseus]|uniref:FAD:protein FMN transferase n=1 Tax=Adhaeribacter pallidiroseus TaxID=2072847 RepID=A0A369QTX2_9BACT|nr:FAD:protein FMN transferase [Adhaeribacter pallidiroseus]RDC66259.1 FAD:protein FMN transferase [Adhaeribacter pallidiroseus]